MKALSILRSNFSFGVTRYLRSPSLLFIGLATPIAAHYMLPDKDAAYSILTINGMKPVLTAPSLGLELGVLAATLLTPLAYIFLRAGPTRHRPWQITDVAPHSRVLWTLGRWVSDTAALWILLAVLTLSGFILGTFRLEDKTNIFQTVVALWLPAAPSLALIASIRLFLDARNLTRKWFGDVIFFFLWVGLLTAGIALGTDTETQMMDSKPLADAFGFTAPIMESVDYPVNEVAIIGPTSSVESVKIEAWRGVTDRSYIVARGFWLMIAAVLATLAGLIWAPIKPKPRNVKVRKKNTNTSIQTSISNIPFKAPKAISVGPTNYIAVILSEIRLMFRNKMWVAVLGAAAILGMFMPFRAIAGPAIFLAIIFPLTETSSRWQNKTTEQLLNTLGLNRMQRTAILLVASICMAMLVILPAFIQAIFHSQLQWLPHMLMIVTIVPAVIVFTGTITRSAVTGRLLMLIGWYVYLSSASL